MCPSAVVAAPMGAVASSAADAVAVDVSGVAVNATMFSHTPVITPTVCPWVPVALTRSQSSLSLDWGRFTAACLTL